MCSVSVHDIQIMNCVRCMTSTVLLILLGIQAVSHSQYYPSSNNHGSSPYPMSSMITIRTSDDTNNYFNSRATSYEPPYRQHQHTYHYLNDPSGSTTVRYFGTRQPIFHTHRKKITQVSGEIEIFRSGESEALAPYRRRYNNRPAIPPSSEEIPGFGITIVENGHRDILIRGTSRPNRRPEIYSVPSRGRPYFGSPVPGESSIERPPDVLPISTPTIFSCQNAEFERVYRRDGRCYNISSTGPCGAQMQFYPEKENGIYGDCDCLPNDGEVSRPLAWWRPHDRCYLLYKMGPCHYNEWLILDSNDRPACAPRKCAYDFNERDKPHEFWFLHEGNCYKTGKHYPRFCSIGQENWKVWFPLGESKPNCSAQRPDPKIRYFLGPQNDLPCKPGHKKMQNGECKRIARYDDDY